MKNGVAIAGGAAAVSLVVAGGLMIGLNGGSNTSGSPHQAKTTVVKKDAKQPSAATVNAMLPAAVTSQACSMNATPTIPASADPRIQEAAKSNPASLAVDSKSAVTQASLVSAARGMSTAAQTAAAENKTLASTETEPAAAVQVPWSRGSQWLGGGSKDDDSLVAPTRCVVAVTVHAPFSPRSAPVGQKLPSFDSYTVVFDSASGQYLGVSAGTDAGDLITGDRTDVS